MSVNIPEILVANGSGISIIVLMLLTRRSTHEKKRMDDRIFENILITALIGLITETASFIIDGKVFFASLTLQYLTNTACTLATVFVGFFWSLYVNFRIYRSTERLRKDTFRLVMPLIFIILLLTVNLFDSSIIFGITDDRLYYRGPLNFLIYAVLFYYYAASIVTVIRFKRSGKSVKFFPIFYFVVPCALGTVLQGLFYGIAVGWLSCAIALGFVSLQIQTLNSYVDDLSGLYNRKYLDHCLKTIRDSRRNDIYGIMLDVNNFKGINDAYGHITGDSAIRGIGAILSEVTFNKATALRMAGDEFLVLLTDGSFEQIKLMQKSIEDALERFNGTSDEPYRLSVSMGVAKCNEGDVDEFLAVLDRKMYSSKKENSAGHAEAQDPAVV